MSKSKKIKKLLYAIAERFKNSEGSAWHEIIELATYRKNRGWKADGYKDWTESLMDFVRRTRKARSTIMQKLSSVEILGRGKVSVDQLERMGATNAMNLRKMYGKIGITKKWIDRAIHDDVEKFRIAVAKAIKPKVEPTKNWTFATLPIRAYKRGEEQVKRIAKLLGLEKRFEIAEYVIIPLLEETSEEALVHMAGEGKLESKTKGKPEVVPSQKPKASGRKTTNAAKANGKGSAHGAKPESAEGGAQEPPAAS